MSAFCVDMPPLRQHRPEPLTASVWKSSRFVGRAWVLHFSFTVWELVDH